MKHKKIERKKIVTPSIPSGIDWEIITNSIATLSQKSFSEADFNMDVCLIRKALKEIGANQTQLEVFEKGIKSARQKQSWPASRRYQGNGL